MRSDLKKQLCEHERYRSWDCYGNYRNRKDFTDNDILASEDDEAFTGTVGGAAARESMKRRYSWMWDNNKSFGEHLSPLKGIVRKNEGRRWDDVYSEICKVAGDRSSTVAAHIFEHLFDYIESDTYLDDDGEIMFVSRGRRRYGGGQHEHISHSYQEFFVHPKNGCITRNKYIKGSRYGGYYSEEAKAGRLAEELKVRRVINSNLELHKIDDVWFAVTIVDREPTIVYKDEFVVYRGFRAGEDKKHTVPKAHREYSRVYDVLKKQTTLEPRVATEKRTLSHKELKAYKLV